MKKRISVGLAVAMVACLTAGSVGAATLDVYPGTGTYPTIQSAVDAALSGDVINVHAGTYNESVMVDNTQSGKNNLTIQSAGDGVVTLDSIQVYFGRDSKISGLNFVSAGSNIVYGSTNVTVENNTMSGGLYSESCENLIVKGNTITGEARIYGAESPVVKENTLHLSSGSGILVQNCTGLPLVSENTVDGIGSYGIRSISTAGEITGNTITGSIANAIYSVGIAPSDIEIYDNVVNTTTTGIILSAVAAHTTVSGNECSGMLYWAGIQVSGTSTYVITDNVCGDNPYGIVIFSSSPMTISGNVCYGNSVGIAGWSGVVLNATMTNNTLYDNSAQGIFIGGDASGATVKNSIFAGNWAGLWSSTTVVGNEGYNCYYGNALKNYRPGDITNYSLPTDITANPEFYSTILGGVGYLYLSCNTSMEVLLGASDGLNMGALPVYGGPCDLSQEDTDAILADCAVAVRNHGQFVSCISDVANNLVEVGYLQGAGSLVKQAAHSNIGKKK